MHCLLHLESYGKSNKIKFNLQIKTTMYLPELSSFPSFSLENLLQTCFGSKSDNVRQVCILIDLPDLSLMKDNRFLEDKIKFPVQAKAFEHFYQPLLQGECESLGFENIDLFAFKTTGGSNLDPEDPATDSFGNTLSLEQDICAKYDLILAITDYSFNRSAYCLSEKIWFSGCNSSWCQRHHFELRSFRRLPSY